MKVAITTSSFAKFSDEPLRLLRERDIEIVLNPYGRTLTELESLELLAGCIAVAAGTEQLNANIISQLPALKIISRCGTGMDSVDVKAAEARGIIVKNTPDGPTEAVAELTVGYALDLLRRISQMDRNLRSGIWEKKMGNLLSGKNVGIVGFGRIGKAVAKLFQAFGCHIFFYDPKLTSSEGTYTRLEFKELLGCSDILTLHCSKPADGSKLLDHENIRNMKTGAFLINAARGGLVDEQALTMALHEGLLAGAALDVYENEPYHGPLSALPNIILTPHIGSYAKEARIKMETDTIINLLEALDRLKA